MGEKSIQIKHTLKIHTTTFPKQLQFYSCKTNQKKKQPQKVSDPHRKAVSSEIPAKVDLMFSSFQGL